MENSSPRLNKTSRAVNNIPPHPSPESAAFEGRLQVMGLPLLDPGMQ